MSKIESVLCGGGGTPLIKRYYVISVSAQSNIANLFNDDNLSENLADISFELEDNTYSKNFEVDPNTDILDEFENTLQGYYELSDNISVSADYFENI
ncbi:hypothetical protein F8M41_002056 [Gigaspora margarita]|uniref:Uncharacterized protein n=1 Tax=Gigaspora margarita TaxID=4874 RepID=A0A8H4A8J3_GIGMA|nr:hypothetical protein F8M41_002056 [Gigaspora margarita]